MKPITRRDLLKITGATLGAITLGGILRAVDQGVFAAGEGTAYQPWKEWEF